MLPYPLNTLNFMNFKKNYNFEKAFSEFRKKKSEKYTYF